MSDIKEEFLDINDVFSSMEHHSDAGPSSNHSINEIDDKPNQSNIEMHDKTDSQKLQLLLRKFGMEFLLPILKNADITYSSLRYLSENDINKVILSVGKRAEFREKLFAWKQENNYDDISAKYSRIESLLIEIRSSIQQQQQQYQYQQQQQSQQQQQQQISNGNIVPVEADTDYDLEAYTSGVVSTILVSSTNPRLLSLKGRSMIITSAIKFYLNRNKFMAEREFRLVASQICAKYKDEQYETFYHKIGNKYSGKLYHTYKNHASRMRKNGSIPLKNKRRREDSEEPTIECVVLQSEDKEWLKCNSEPWDEVIQYWHRSFNVRRLELSNVQNGNIEYILQEWPLYQMSYGKLLIDEDFKYLNIADNCALFLKWQKFTEKFLAKARDLIKDKLSLIQLNELSIITNKDIYDAILFDLISSVLAPSSFAKNKITGKVWRASIEDSQRQFMLRLDHIEELQPNIDELATKLEQNNLKLQPMIAFIRQPDSDEYEIIGIYEKLQYKYATFLDAVSNIFKLHYVLNVQYQKHCCSVWEFIQCYFFEINTRKCSVRVHQMTSELS